MLSRIHIDYHSMKSILSLSLFGLTLFPGLLVAAPTADGLAAFALLNPRQNTCSTDADCDGVAGHPYCECCQILPSEPPIVSVVYCCSQTTAGSC